MHGSVQFRRGGLGGVEGRGVGLLPLEGGARRPTSPRVSRSGLAPGPAPGRVAPPFEPRRSAPESDDRPREDDESEFEDDEELLDLALSLLELSLFELSLFELEDFDSLFLPSAGFPSLASRWSRSIISRTLASTDRTSSASSIAAPPFDPGIGAPCSSTTTPSFVTFRYTLSVESPPPDDDRTRTSTRLSDRSSAEAPAERSVAQARGSHRVAWAIMWDSVSRRGDGGGDRPRSTAEERSPPRGSSRDVWIFSAPAGRRLTRSSQPPSLFGALASWRGGSWGRETVSSQEYRASRADRTRDASPLP